MGQAIALVQGVATAVSDDLTLPFSQSGKSIFDVEIDTGTIPTYEPLFGNQNAMALGRVIGHAVTFVLGAVGVVGSLLIGGAIITGGALLAVPSGGASAVAGTAASAVAVTAGACNIFGCG